MRIQLKSENVLHMMCQNDILFFALRLRNIWQIGSKDAKEWI